ncbi:hypothetical protein BO94DRAFT_152862 [Aspergillus sclerotioniger CBS 115572]|uniref:Uncharacterized protein n=1 Tax=Aspergillus sclerotioniger CBS 115572 TaxID=1450535 RepID=A0A317W2V7_9EURO|nr:hypothetical protein BO94DRAFT_152862 [Aspergillus sclerotioniger CBS 115572]PWY80926.1 hypothetical protein BO94DRAFT_152862 [Aspergillus sclerotioniger CBS 115572]
MAELALVQKSRMLSSSKARRLLHLPGRFLHHLLTYLVFMHICLFLFSFLFFSSFFLSFVASEMTICLSEAISASGQVYYMAL